MAITRREFIARASISLVAALPVTRHAASQSAELTLQSLQSPDWSTVRRQFDLTHDFIHLAPFYLASHPRPVQEAIQKYRRLIDANPVLTIDRGVFGPQSNLTDVADELQHYTGITLQTVAEYIGGQAENIAVTDSTTMGLGLVYNGMMLKLGDEMLTTVHDFFSHHESIRLAAERSGASMRKIALFDNFDQISEDEIVSRVRRNIRPNTRTFGITWVHSASGVKLPVRAIAAALNDINRNRNEQDRVLLIVDGVHGFGVEDENVADLGCDVFISGTHKWIFGPRGTGIVWATDAAWARMRPTIPSFVAGDLWAEWREKRYLQGNTTATRMNCGGFKPYEHQWAMADAFRFIRNIGRKRIAERTYELNDQCKEGLANMKGIKLYTPRDRRLSAGLICFDVDDIRPEEVVQRLLARKIVITATPYGQSYARLAPSIVSSPEEIDTALREIRALLPA